MRNLVVAVAGDASMHGIWKADNPQFDLLVIYYGSVEGRYSQDGKYYATAKGSKFNILYQVAIQQPELFVEYDAIFVPDDDIFMSTEMIQRFLDTFHEYKLDVAQPSILGWVSVPITAHIPFSKLRYVNWVEIMCPCFSSKAFGLCLPTFIENKTNWCIEFLWNKKLGEPRDRIAIVDSVIAVHTRPCFYGDTYWNNNATFDSAMAESKALMTKHSIPDKRIVYSTVPADINEFNNRESNNKFVPSLELLKPFMTSLRSRNIKYA